ncbi:MAG: zinc ribbon domain-containing protein [Desulfobacterales bacterium]|nr:zinc ribbon domain-containing protein [Desulfobacterales bacterium]
MICPRCGNKIAPPDRFCGNCGDRLAQQPVAAKAKKPLFARLSPKQLRAGKGILVGVIIVIALLLLILLAGKKRRPVPRPTNLGAELTPWQPGEGTTESGTNVVYGQVISLQRGSIMIQSLADGKAYTLYVGRRTNYSPQRYPSVGDKVKVLYIDDRGYMKATQVQIRS